MLKDLKKYPLLSVKPTRRKTELEKGSCKVLLGDKIQYAQRGCIVYLYPQTRRGFQVWRAFPGSHTSSRTGSTSHGKPGTSSQCLALFSMTHLHPWYQQVSRQEGNTTFSCISHPPCAPEHSDPGLEEADNNQLCLKPGSKAGVTSLAFPAPWEGRSLPRACTIHPR